MSISSVSSSDSGFYADNIGNAVDRGDHLQHSVEKCNRSDIEPLYKAIKESITLRDSDSTDERIVKISAIIGTFLGSAGAVAGAIPTSGISVVAIPVGYGLGMATGHGIVKVKHVVEDKCVIL